MAELAAENLYVHFPFCRRKCTYCALHSRAGSTPESRADYVSRLARAIDRSLAAPPPAPSRSGDSPHASGDCPRSKTSHNTKSSTLSTVYLGGGSPALCDLGPLFTALKPYISSSTEFSVELHPLDATCETLQSLADGGVNRISMGVQSLEDQVLAHMGRGYSFADAERAFALTREYFDNAGIDLIIGYPTAEEQKKTLSPRWARLARWGLRHCSVYSLILEEKSILFHQLQRNASRQGQSPAAWGQSPLDLPSDDEVLNKIAIVSRFLADIGLKRYEISNYAAPGYECRHNMATWHGEDYLGLGDGAHGRLGLLRTENYWGQSPAYWGQPPKTFTITQEKDEIERRIFALRTRDGLSTAGHPEWTAVLDRFTEEGLLVKSTGKSRGDSPRYRLTERGTEVCDSILAELVQP